MRYSVLGILFVLVMAFMGTGCAQKEPECVCVQFNKKVLADGEYAKYMAEQEMSAKQQQEPYLQSKPLRLTVPVVVLFEKSCFFADNSYALTSALDEIPENGEVRFIVKEGNVAAATNDMIHNGYVLLKDEKYIVTSNEEVFRRLTFHKVKAMK